ncbi:MULTISPECIES: GNAT family N-acetyltransferase [unclassified Psychrobacter]|uniref:GNAT family N-acetyltransferase n=2 Tax=Psychrobacter TaxID=497 RepID=UPI003F4715B6
MTNITLNAIPPNSSIYNLDEQFMVHLANKQDLPEILAIYNQSIAGKQATANLTPVTCEERAEWFDEHLNSPTRPIYVVRAAVISADDDKIVTQTKSPIVAWGSFSDLYARTAYHISTEISIYLHQGYQGKGLGSLLARWMLAQAPNLGIQNVVALVFAHNKPSLGLFHKLGFEQWGYMPKVCDMQGFIADVVMLGKTVVVEQTKADNA